MVFVLSLRSYYNKILINISIIVVAYIYIYRVNLSKIFLSISHESHSLAMWNPWIRKQERYPTSTVFKITELKSRLFK